jgi:hypothetical protein
MDRGNIQQEINKYKKFKKVDGATYRKVNQFLRKRTYITAREWALARLCTDFRTSGGAEMTFIGKHLPELVPFMEDTYTPQAVNQARNSFKKKVRKSSATFFYGAMCGFFTTDELDDLLFEASEVARFLLEVEGTTLDIDEEIDIEDRITKVMRSVGEAAKTILKTRSEEGELLDQSPDLTLKKNKDHANSSFFGILDPSVHNLDKRPDVNDTFKDADSSYITSHTNEPLTVIDPNIALGGSISYHQTSHILPRTKDLKHDYLQEASEKSMPSQQNGRNHIKHIGRRSMRKNKGEKDS